MCITLASYQTTPEYVSYTCIHLTWWDKIRFSVRVSNELGAAHPRTAKFSVVVVVFSSFLIGLLLSVFLLVFRSQYPSLFAESESVKRLVYELTPLLAFCIVVNNIQPALSGVAIGAGWQALVAYVNIACYYLFGIPLGLILGYKFNMGVQVSGTFQFCFKSRPFYNIWPIN